MAVKDSLSYRYAVVLEELRLEASQNIQQNCQQQNLVDNTSSSDEPQLRAPPIALTLNNPSFIAEAGVDLGYPDGFDTGIEMPLSDTDPTSLLTVLGWTEFDSLVCIENFKAKEDTLWFGK